MRDNTPTIWARDDRQLAEFVRYFSQWNLQEEFSDTTDRYSVNKIRNQDAIDDAIHGFCDRLFWGDE